MSACWNGPHAPHVETGSLVNFGDTLVKAGNVTAAHAAYQAATARAGFASWRYAVQSRLTDDLTARAALYGGAPSQWPPVGIPCTGCHGS